MLVHALLAVDPSTRMLLLARPCMGRASVADYGMTLHGESIFQRCLRLLFHVRSLPVAGLLIDRQGQGAVRSVRDLARRGCDWGGDRGDAWGFGLAVPRDGCDLD